MKKDKIIPTPSFGSYSLLVAALGLGAATHQRGENLHALVNPQHQAQQIVPPAPLAAEETQKEQFIAWMDLL